MACCCWSPSAAATDISKLCQANTGSRLWLKRQRAAWRPEVGPCRATRPSTISPDFWARWGGDGFTRGESGNARKISATCNIRSPQARFLTLSSSAAQTGKSPAAHTSPVDSIAVQSGGELSNSRLLTLVHRLAVRYLVMVSTKGAIGLNTTAVDLIIPPPEPK